MNAILIALVLMAEPGPKTIPPKDKVEQAAKLAAEAKAKSKDAAALYVKALELHWHPPYAFAAARAFEDAGEWQKALEYYRKYAFETGAPEQRLLQESNDAIRRLSTRATDAGVR